MWLVVTFRGETEGTQVVGYGRLMVVAAGATLALAVGAARPASAAGWVCATEDYSWFGSTMVEAGASFATGVSVANENGTELHVNAVDFAVEGAGADALGVWVGESPAAGGLTITGGVIGVVNTSAEPLLVMSVALSIDRCSEVDQVSPSLAALAVEPLPAPPLASQPLASQPLAPQPLISVASAPAPAAAAPTDALPETGASSLALILGAFGCTFVGVNLVALSRWRRSTACGPAT